MPCNDGPPSKELLEYERDVKRGPSVGLCIACAALQAAGILPESLRPWYEAHLETDRISDLLVVAAAERLKAETEAKATGLKLSATHPKVKAAVDLYGELHNAEWNEKRENVNLAQLKPI